MKKCPRLHRSPDRPPTIRRQLSRRPRKIAEKLAGAHRQAAGGGGRIAQGCRVESGRGRRASRERRSTGRGRKQGPKRSPACSRRSRGLRAAGRPLRRKNSPRPRRISMRQHAKAGEAEKGNAPGQKAGGGCLCAGGNPRGIEGRGRSAAARRFRRGGPATGGSRERDQRAAGRQAAQDARRGGGET